MSSQKTNDQATNMQNKFPNVWSQNFYQFEEKTLKKWDPNYFEFFL